MDESGDVEDGKREWSTDATEDFVKATVVSEVEGPDVTGDV